MIAEVYEEEVPGIRHDIAENAGRLDSVHTRLEQFEQQITQRLNAIEKLQKRISQVVADQFNDQYDGEPTLESDLLFQDDQIISKQHQERRITFERAVELSYMQRVSLSATGFYRTPKVHFDRDQGQGRPYHYYAFGMAVTEVMVDTLTGQYQNLRTDILHDVGDPLNSRIDIGQVEDHSPG